MRQSKTSFTVQELDGQGHWSTQALRIYVGDTVEWTWTNYHNVIETDAAGSVARPAEVEAMLTFAFGVLSTRAMLTSRGARLFSISSSFLPSSPPSTLVPSPNKESPATSWGRSPCLSAFARISAGGSSRSTSGTRPAPATWSMASRASSSGASRNSARSSPGSTMAALPTCSGVSSRTSVRRRPLRCRRSGTLAQTTCCCCSVR